MKSSVLLGIFSVFILVSADVSHKITLWQDLGVSFRLATDVSKASLGHYLVNAENGFIYYGWKEKTVKENVLLDELKHCIRNLKLLKGVYPT